MDDVPQIVISSISGHNINQAIKKIAEIIQSIPCDSVEITTWFLLVYIFSERIESPLYYTNLCSELLT